MSRFRALHDFVDPYLTDSGRLAFRTLLGLSASTVVAHACAAGVLLLLARTLVPAQFGMLSVALTAQGYLVLLGSVACGAVVVREVVRRPEDVDVIVTSFLALTALSSALVCGATLVAVALAPMSGNERWLLSLVAVGSVPAAMSSQPLFDAHHRQASGATIAALAELLALLAVAALWWRGALGLPAVAAVYAAKWTLSSAGQLLAYHGTVRRIQWSWSRPDILLLLRSSWPILLASMLFVVPLSSGVVLVRVRGGPDEAALFGLAYQVANAYQIFGALAVQTVQPHIYGEYGLHQGFLVKLGVFAALFLGGTGILALAGGWFLVHLLLAPFYRAALGVMPWLLVAAALLTMSRLLSAYLLRLDEERFVLVAQLAGALLYCLACLALPAPWIRAGAATLAPLAVLVGVAASAWRIRAKLPEVRLP